MHQKLNFVTQRALRASHETFFIIHYITAHSKLVCRDTFEAKRNISTRSRFNKSYSVHTSQEKLGIKKLTQCLILQSYMWRSNKQLTG